MKNSITISSIISLIITLIFIAFVTIFSELSHNFKNFLKTLTGHHWVSKSLISIILYIFIFLGLQKFIKKDLNIEKLLKITIYVVIFSSLAIAIFYLIEI